MACEFEATVQFDLVREMIADIRSGKVAEDPWALIEKAACVLGSFAAWMRGEKPEDDVPVGLGAPPETLVACCDALEAELAKPATASLSPMVIMLLKQLIKLLVKEYL